MNHRPKKEGIILFIAVMGGVILNLFTMSLKAQEVAVKTNFLHWGTLSPNIGVEMVIGKKSTLDIPIVYNPFEFSENKKWKHLLLQPEIRWWFCEPFNGSYFGVHAHYARYNIGNVEMGSMKLPMDIRLGDLSDYRYDGWLTGVGLTYGYQLYLSPRLNLEFAIGAGYAYLSHKKYECPKCGDFIGDEQKNYLGPTKAAVSLIYIIK